MCAGSVAVSSGSAYYDVSPGQQQTQQPLYAVSADDGAGVMQMTLKKTAVVSNQHDASANERLYNQVGQHTSTAMSPGHASSGAVRSAQSPTYEAMPDNFGHTAGDVVYTSTPVDDGATYEAVEAQQPASSDLYATVARPGARGSAYSTLSTANSDLQQSKLALSETCVIRFVHPRWHTPVIYRVRFGSILACVEW